MHGVALQSIAEKDIQLRAAAKFEEEYDRRVSQAFDEREAEVAKLKAKLEKKEAEVAKYEQEVAQLRQATSIMQDGIDGPSLLLALQDKDADIWDLEQQVEDLQDRLKKGSAEKPAAEFRAEAERRIAEAAANAAAREAELQQELESAEDRAATFFGERARDLSSQIDRLEQELLVLRQDFAAKQSELSLWKGRALLYQEEVCILYTPLPDQITKASL